MRRLLLSSVLLLAACSPTSGDGKQDRETLPCALNGAATFAPACALERSRSADGVILTVRHPDGGFRRFIETGEQGGVAPADGAERAVFSRSEGGIEVLIGGDRYRFPAR